MIDVYACAEVGIIVVQHIFYMCLINVASVFRWFRRRSVNQHLTNIPTFGNYCGCLSNGCASGNYCNDATHENHPSSWLARDGASQRVVPAGDFHFISSSSLLCVRCAVYPDAKHWLCWMSLLTIVSGVRRLNVCLVCVSHAWNWVFVGRRRGWVHLASLSGWIASWWSISSVWMLSCAVGLYDKFYSVVLKRK